MYYVPVIWQLKFPDSNPVMCGAPSRHTESIAGHTRPDAMNSRGFPKMFNTFLKAPRIRCIVFWGLYWGPPILGNYHLS